MGKGRLPATATLSTTLAVGSVAFLGCRFVGIYITVQHEPVALSYMNTERTTIGTITRKLLPAGLKEWLWCSLGNAAITLAHDSPARLLSFPT